MNKLAALFGFAFLGLGAVACAGETDLSDAPAGDEATGEDDLRTAGIQSIRVNRSAGFRPPPQPGKCWPSGAWTFDFETRQLTGNACLDQKPNGIDKVLSEDDAERIRAAVRDVRTTSKPAACPTDMPVSSLSVKRAKSETRYVDQRAACGGGSIAVKSGLSELVALLEELSAPTPSNAAPCVRTGCSGQICADGHMFSTCEFRPEYACYKSAVCERGADGKCGFRKTAQLTACLGK